MTLSATLRTFGWLARDTFRQARAGGILWILLVISGLAIIVCASASIEGDVPLAAPGETPDFLPRNDPDASDPAKLKSSGVAVASGQLAVGFRHDSHSAQPRCADRRSIFSSWFWPAALPIRSACC